MLFAKSSPQNAPKPSFGHLKPAAAANRQLSGARHKVAEALASILRTTPGVEAVHIGYDGSGKRLQHGSLFVRYNNTSVTDPRPADLIQVSLEQEAKMAKPEFRSMLIDAKAHAAQLGWSFKLLTEASVDMVRLDNARFLERFLTRQAEPGHLDMLVDRLDSWGGGASVRAVLAGIYWTQKCQGILLGDLWAHVARGDLFMDLHEPLTMRSIVWSD